jgi:DNA-directed RNA polymerase specialized sigma24 family protein
MADGGLEKTLQLISQLDEGALERLMEAYRGRVFNYLRRLGASYETAEDVLQDTFLNAYRALRSGRYQHVSEAGFAGWLRTIRGT